MSDPVTTDFVVLGERRDDSSKLLLRGDDGGFYVYDLDSAHVAAVDVDDRWAIDTRQRPATSTTPHALSADGGFEEGG